jgi:hypothetical protein
VKEELVRVLFLGIVLYSLTEVSDITKECDASVFMVEE